MSCMVVARGWKPTAAGAAAFVMSGLGLAPPPSLLPTTAPAASPAAGGAAAPAEWACGLSYAQRFQAFLLLSCSSAALYAASFLVFLPMLLFAPAKFATAFTMASLMWLTGFALLWGPRATVLGLLAPEKRLFTLAYVSSLALSLYSALVSQSYFLVLLAVVVQMCAAAWYSASYVPGGTLAVGALGRMCAGGLVGTLRSIVGLR